MSEEVMTVDSAYEDFIRAKAMAQPDMGFTIDDSEINPLAKPHQRSIIHWKVKRGRAACFCAFGLGKTLIQLETVRLICTRAGGRGLIVCPLGVRLEFMKDAHMLRTGESNRITDEQREQLAHWIAADPCNLLPEVRFVRSIEECGETGIYLTNYETIRDGKLDPRQFAVISLDEAGILRGFGGTATFRKLMGLFEGSGKFRFVSTATPSPNDLLELAAYSGFLDVLDISGVKTRFFQRDSTHADQLTLMPHKEKDFWIWCAGWACFVEQPSDIGFADDGYIMPPMTVRWHELPSNHEDSGQEPSGQRRMFRNSALGVTMAAKEKRETIDVRVAKLATIIDSTDKTLYGWDQFIIWSELNPEQSAVDGLMKQMGIPFSSLYGNDGIDKREPLMDAWRNRETVAFSSKPGMYGCGINMQQCRHEVFLGVGYKFYAFIQAIHRVLRFGQDREVIIDIIYTEAEREVRRALERKWENHKKLMANMTEIIRKYGLGASVMDEHSRRKMTVERQDKRGDGWIMANNDCVAETKTMAQDSVDLILTSIPFSQMYAYSESYLDMGCNEDNAQFW